MVKKKLLLACAGIALCMSSLGAAPAADPKPEIVAHASFGSLSQLQNLADQLEVPLPPFLTAAGIEDQFSFVGQGGMNTGIPIQIDFVAGDALAQQQEALFYFPINAGHAPISTFLQNGTPLGTDGALLNGIPFRRTGNYLVWGSTPDLVQALKPNQLPDAVKDSPLAMVDLDAGIFRKAAPKKMAEFRRQQLAEINPNGTKGEQAGGRFAVDAMTNGLDYISFRLDQVDEYLRLTTQVKPCPTLALHPCQKPGLPRDCAFRMDWQPPRQWAGRSLDALINMTGAEDFYSSTKIKPDDYKKVLDLLSKIGDSLLGGDEATYAMEVLDDGPVFYCVSHDSQPRDLDKDLQEIKQTGDSIKSIDAKSDGKFELSTHKLADGTLVHRATITSTTNPTIYLDIIQQGDTRMLTISRSANDSVNRLMNLPDAGPLTEPASGYFDGKNMLDLIVAAGNKTEAGLKDEDRDLLNKLLKNQRVTWKVATMDNKLTVVIDVPIALIKNITQNAPRLQYMMSKLQEKNG